jgi:hypothetical protein
MRRGVLENRPVQGLARRQGQLRDDQRDNDQDT